MESVRFKEQIPKYDEEPKELTSWTEYLWVAHVAIQNMEKYYRLTFWRSQETKSIKRIPRRSPRTKRDEHSQKIKIEKKRKKKIEKHGKDWKMRIGLRKTE